MFSNQAYLDKKTGPFRVGRHNYLEELVHEYQSTVNTAAKKEVLANLVNFAYDPINFDYLKSLGVPAIFLQDLTDDDGDIVEFAISGICNMCQHRDTKEYLLRNNVIDLLMAQLASKREETIVTCITTLIYMLSPPIASASLDVTATMLRFSNSEISRVANVAKLFLQDCCSVKTVEEAIKMHQV